MKIFPINSHSIKTKIFAVALSVIPTPAAKDVPRVLPNVQTTIGVAVKNVPYAFNERVLEGLVEVADTNFRGGIIHKFDSASVQLLKKRILRKPENITYQAPIKNDPNVYLEPFGRFFAPRPGDNKKMRPHMGLDIFVSKFARKPKKPVYIQAPVDGVVISNKRARKEDNVIANMVSILGVDGRRYAFDHMARPTDYTDSIPLPELGTLVKAGDTLGIVGRTGETTLWHLHLNILTDEKLAQQLSDPYWIKLAEQSPFNSPRGQVNPLDSVEAGPIAKKLLEYRGAESLNSYPPLK